MVGGTSRRDVVLGLAWGVVVRRTSDCHPKLHATSNDSVIFRGSLKPHKA